MSNEACRSIDYCECGTGPTIVLVPGSCSTGAAWRPVIATWHGQFRRVTHPAVRRANALLSECMSRAALATIDTAAHFMIATHPNEVGRLIAEHVHSAEAVE